MNLRQFIGPVIALTGVLVSWGAAGEPPHEPAEIPFDIDHFSEDQRAVLQAGTEADTSGYYILSRPVFFQIVGTGDDADETRNSQRIDRKVDVLIYGLGEERDGHLVDYGWIEQVESGTRIWEMTPDNTVFAGGALRNRKTVTEMTLEPGTYRLRYLSNESHSFAGWRDDPPERPTFYGVTVFNLTALPLIEDRLKKAGVGSLAKTLEHPHDGSGPHPSITLPLELARVLTDYEKAWQAKDEKALAALFAEDGFVLSSGRPPVRGRKQIEQRYENSGGPLALRALAFATEGSLGYIIGGYARHRGEPDVGKFTLTLVKGPDDRWLIMSDMDNGNQQ